MANDIAHKNKLCTTDSSKCCNSKAIATHHRRLTFDIELSLIQPLNINIFKPQSAIHTFKGFFLVNCEYMTKICMKTINVMITDLKKTYYRFTN